MKAVVTILVLAVGTMYPGHIQAQVRTNTPTLKGHTIDETFQQFVAESGSASRARMSECSALSASNRRTIKYCDEFGALSDQATNGQPVTGHFVCGAAIDDNDACQDFEGLVTFENNKLVVIMLRIFGQEWGSVLSDLTAKFGKPTETGLEHIQHSDGGLLNLHTGKWKAPVYVVDASEMTSPAYDNTFVEVIMFDRNYLLSRQPKAGSSLD
ncbi:MAG TPA: hypothetical protein VG225_01100 [Terracidiphilus sp.]|jgi:hypothetical protein|nr:hypothetical protein [Terracidiphilus sp.]